MNRMAFLAIAATLAAVVSAPASALTHRDSIYQACVRGGDTAAACACAADSYAEELTDRELAFYARINGRMNDQRALMTVMAEVGMSIPEVGALAAKLRRIQADVQNSCGVSTVGGR